MLSPVASVSLGILFVAIAGTNVWLMPGDEILVIWVNRREPFSFQRYGLWYASLPRGIKTTGFRF